MLKNVYPKMLMVFFVVQIATTAADEPLLPDTQRVDLEPIEADGVGDRSSVRASTEKIQLAADTMRLSGEPGQNVELEAEKRIKSVDGFDADILSVEVVQGDPSALRLRMKHEGSSSLRIVDEDDKARHVNVVVALPDLGLGSMLQRLFPKLSIQVVPLQRAVLLRGVVDSEKTKEHVVEIAEQYFSAVLNQLELMDGSEPQANDRQTVTPTTPGEKLQSTEVAALRSDIAELHQDVRQLIAMFKLRNAMRNNEVTAERLRIEEKLDTPVSLHFQDTPFTEIVHYIASTHQLNIVIDKLAIEAQDLLPSEKVSIDVDDVKLRTALNLLLKQAGGLVYTVEDEVLRITDGLELRSDSSITTDNQDDVSGTGRTKLLFFMAGYCPPCQQMAPVVRKLEQEFALIERIDTTRQPELTRKHSVERIPTFIMIQDGVEVRRLTGIRSEKELRTLLVW